MAGGRQSRFCGRKWRRTDSRATRVPAALAKGKGKTMTAASKRERRPSKEVRDSYQRKLCLSQTNKNSGISNWTASTFKQGSEIAPPVTHSAFEQLK